MSTPHGSPGKRHRRYTESNDESEEEEEIRRPAGNNPLQTSPTNPRKRLPLQGSQSRERSVTPSFGPTSTTEEVLSRSTRSGKRYDQDANQDRGNVVSESSPQAGPSSRSRRASSMTVSTANPPKPSPFAFITENPHIKIILVIVLLLIAAMGISAFFPNENQTSDKKSIVPNPWKEKRTQLRSILKELEKEFVSQSPETFIQINALLDSSLRKLEQNQPSAIAVLVPPDMSVNSFPRCFIRKIGNVINTVFEPELVIPVKELNLNTFSETQNITHLHDDIKAYFDRGGKAVIVEDVEKLNQEAHLLVFHAFCDNSRAYQKRATFFFLIPVPQHIYESYDWNFRKRGHISDAVLNDAWSQVLSPDKRPALIARVAAATVLLNSGDTC